MLKGSGLRVLNLLIKVFYLKTVASTVLADDCLHFCGFKGTVTSDFFHESVSPSP
jgi:hypothetical protein